MLFELLVLDVEVFVELGVLWVGGVEVVELFVFVLVEL